MLCHELGLSKYKPIFNLPMLHTDQIVKGHLSCTCASAPQMMRMASNASASGRPAMMSLRSACSRLAATLAIAVAATSAASLPKLFVLSLTWQRKHAYSQPNAPLHTGSYMLPGAFLSLILHTFLEEVRCVCRQAACKGCQGITAIGKSTIG